MHARAAYIVELVGHTLTFSVSKLLAMLETIAILFIVLWLLGMLTSYTLGGLIHLLLVIAVVSVILRLISGRRV
jgi:hypothetical protein